MATTAGTKLTSGLLSAPYIPHHRRNLPTPPTHYHNYHPKPITLAIRRNEIVCKATEVSSSGVSEDRRNWVPVVPLSALPKGERRVIIQDGETILLLWYKDEVFAIENRSPAEGAYSEGLINAKLTQF
ncbi:putative rieske-like [2Fe-2S] domain, NirD-type, rieske [2Fe-2S] iron-sulfur domain superfamily [Helianthus annuus]|nr:putative rieske-like [2Fe-2S] domain, NirD-type, rieske [2Fe-2S] iron-sulfur domain superfamily [Helianthus annuus]KAJ0756480.1 putative rieske-like [2Fe-2S] domain, NirD-type, rieske [2Fe-2S] iron-sulfur domain superfamily [Helianthus annuus]KAJ0760237.1 putative rieske-like [2Fe-2S] domain, NirD-type, rieske [2Fe-2S] iron-sulfur domain superfamily [Helianthus annuus]